MRLTIKEQVGGKTYISFKDTTEVDSKIHELYETFVIEVLKNSLNDQEEFIEKYFPKDGEHKSPIGLSKNSFSLVHTVLIERDFQENFQDIFIQLTPSLLKLQEDINQAWKDFL